MRRDQSARRRAGVRAALGLPHARGAATAQLDIHMLDLPGGRRRLEGLRQGLAVRREVPDRPALQAHEMAVLFQVSVEPADAPEHPLPQLAVADEATQVAIDCREADARDVRPRAHEHVVGRRMAVAAADDSQNQLAMRRLGALLHAGPWRQHKRRFDAFATRRPAGR